MIDQALQDEVLDLLKRLIACRSLSGEEQGVTAILQAYLLKNGFESAKTDRFGSLVAGVKGKRRGRRILFDGHVDTVPADNASDWTTPPFVPTVRDGKLKELFADDETVQVRAGTAEFPVAPETTRVFEWAR